MWPRTTRFLLILLLAACDRPDASAEITVFAAASLADAFTSVAMLAEELDPPLVLRFNFAGSQELALQLEHGARTDVFASADDRWMSHVVDLELAPGSPVLFARNRIAVVTPQTNPAKIAGVGDLGRPGLKIVIAGPAVPAGAYARTLVAAWGESNRYGHDFEVSVLRNVVSEEPNVRAVLAKVQLGEADAGFVYASDAAAASPPVRVVPLPPWANVTASYPVVSFNERGARFVRLLRSDRGQRALQAAGLLPLGGGP